MQIKKNISLIVAIAIPIAMILFVAASIYLPSIFVKPHDNFVYTFGDAYARPYSVSGTTLTENDATTTYPGAALRASSIV